MRRITSGTLSIVCSAGLFCNAGVAVFADSTAYDFSQMTYSTSWGVDYNISNGKIDITFSGKYKEIQLNLPEALDMSDCSSVTFNANSTNGNIAFKLYDADGNEVAVRYDFKGSGDCTFTPDSTAKVTKIGIMAMDDASYSATVNSVSFKMSSQSTSTAYDFTKMTYNASWGGTSYDISGSKANVSFTKKYGEVQFKIPDILDMSNCSSVTFNASSQNGKLGFKIYDVDGKEVAATYDFKGNGNCTFTPDSTAKINCVGIMAMDDASYSATINSVSFKMNSGIEIVVDAKENLLTTYGKVFGKLGGAVTAAKLANPKVLEYIKAEHDVVTPGNEMKPDALLGSSASTMSVSEAKSLGYYIPEGYSESTVPKINFDTIDGMLKTCYENNLLMRGHTLVWHQQTPDWYFREGYSSTGNYVSKDVMNKRMEFYIKTVMNHVYSGQYGSAVYAWDVVNEYLHGVNSGSGWQKIYGSNLGTQPDFAKKAFEYAYETLEKYNLQDKVKLFYNDYNTYMEINDVINLVNYINKDEDNKICAGVGMQSHLDTSYPSASLYKQALQSFVDAGFEVQITELDVTCSSESTQAQYYYDLMKGILEVKKAGGNISALIFWGLTDEDSWRSSQNPLLYSDYSTQKPAYASVIKAFYDAGYTLDETPEKVILKGDVNENGVVDLADFVKLQEYLADNKTELNKDNADLNGDGIITIADLAKLKIIILS